MVTKSFSTVFIMIAAAACARAAERPRVFVTESGAPQLSGDAKVADVRGSLKFTGGTSPENIEVMKSFVQRCPGAVVTSNRERADFVLRLDHEAINPTTPFVHGNKVAVFNKNDDLVYSNSSRLLGNAVKGACSAIMSRSGK